MTHRPAARLIRHLLGLTALILVAGCASIGSAPAPTPTAQAPLRIAMVISGSAADGGWNSSGVEGLRMLRDRFGAQIDYKELPPHDDWDKQVPADWTAGLRAYAEQGYPLIFAHGRWFDKAVAEVAPSFPNTRFVDTGGSVNGPNYASTTLKNEETGYLLGVLAASLTKNDTIGVILGAQLRPIISTGEAFKLGVQATNPDAKVIERVLNNLGPDVTKNNMNNPAGATDAAQELIDQGVDLLFVHSAAANVGAIKLAQQHNIRVLNYGKDLTTLAPKNVVANGLQLIPVTMAKMTEFYTAGRFEGKNYIMGLTEGAVKLSPLSDEFIPTDVQAHVQQVQQELIDGKIKLEIQR